MLTIIHPTHSKRQRSQMPQVEDAESFRAFLRTHQISYRVYTRSPRTLKPTQNDINLQHVFDILQKGLDLSRFIIVCKDDHIFDGHHRWYAAHVQMTRIRVLRVGVSFDTLLRLIASCPCLTAAKDIGTL